MEDRQIRGYAIISKGDKVRMISQEKFLVPSQSRSEMSYIVNFRKVFTCECPDFRFNKQKCKHIFAVEFLLRMRAKTDEIEFEDTVEQTKCGYCNLLNVKKNGKRKVDGGYKQRYYCEDCKKTFVEDSEFAKLKANPKIVTLSMDLYYKGLSLRDITDTLNQFFSIKLHHETVRRWIMKFSQAISEYTKQFKPDLSKDWHTDEQMIKVNGEWLYNWNVMDEHTRFLIANNITKTRYIRDAQEVFQKAKKNVKDKPQFMITDGLFAYERAISKEFWKYPRTKHLRLTSIRDKRINNNIIERFHSTFRERDKVMRGFKAEHTAELLTEGFNTWYNFIRPHQALNGMTPSQVARIDLGLDRNRWLSLLRRSLTNK